MFEAVGSYEAGIMSEEKVNEYVEKICPTCGSCSGMYTANSMNCMTEAIGMGLRGNGTIPAVYSDRIRLAKHAGMQVMEMFRRNIRPSDIMTKDALHILSDNMHLLSLLRQRAQCDPLLVALAGQARLLRFQFLHRRE